MKIIINNKEYEVIKANTFTKKFIGLMGKKNITIGMYFPKTKSIHTFFMKDNIDVIMINKKNKIIYYQTNVKRNKIIIKKEAHDTIELPKNTINQNILNLYIKIIN